MFGYTLGALTKPLFAVTPNLVVVLSARLLDRVGKGIRGAPRDALIADIAPKAMRGAAFGLRQSLDTVGAFVGPLLAVGLMLLWDNKKPIPIIDASGVTVARHNKVLRTAGKNNVTNTTNTTAGKRKLNFNFLETCSFSRS